MKKIFFPFFILLIVVIFVLGISFANKKTSRGLFDVQLWVTDYYSSQNGELQLIGGYSFNDEALSFPLLVSSGRSYDKMDFHRIFLKDSSHLQVMRGNDVESDVFQDNTYYYLLDSASIEYPRIDTIWIGLKKEDLPNLQLIGNIGIQDRYATIGYSSGYLAVPPYKFKVDAKSFEFYPQKFWDYKNEDEHARNEYLKTEGQNYCQNGKIQYVNCIGSDRDWIYRWTYGEDKNYHLVRTKRASDFKILTSNELLGVITKDHKISLKFIGMKKPENKQTVIDSSESFIGIYQDENFVYFEVPDYGVWSFPVDTQTLKYEEKDIQLPDDEYPTDYSLLHDKNYYYQLVYYNDNGYYELKRIKKSRFALWDSLRNLLN
ncbi:MAG: hypothetical protein HG456_001355 [candidate division SR1 bacterium]|nr:hypothetical protein [candidate division SR1 bacterium]